MVISFKFKRTEKPEQRSCDHINVIVDEETRTIQCEKCDITLDAFEYLKSVCYKDEHAFQYHSQLLIEVEKLKKRYINLTKEVERLNNIKKQLKS